MCVSPGRESGRVGLGQKQGPLLGVGKNGGPRGRERQVGPLEDGVRAQLEACQTQGCCWDWGLAGSGSQDFWRSKGNL